MTDDDRRFRRLLADYESLHATIAKRRDETKRLNKRYNELKAQILKYLQYRQRRDPSVNFLIYPGYDKARYKLKVQQSTSKVRIGQKMLQKNMEKYSARNPRIASVLREFYGYLQEKCKHGGKRQTKLSRTKMRAKKNSADVARQRERRHSAPATRTDGADHRSMYYPLDQGDGDMTPDMHRMVQRIQSTHRLHEQEHSV